MRKLSKKNSSSGVVPPPFSKSFGGCSVTSIASVGCSPQDLTSTSSVTSVSSISVTSESIPIVEEDKAEEKVEESGEGKDGGEKKKVPQFYLAKFDFEAVDESEVILF